MINKIFKIIALSFLLVNTFLLCNTLIANDIPKKKNDNLNSFAWSISSGLQNIGVTISVANVQACLGTAFSPNLSTKYLCFSEGIQAIDDNAFTNILLGVGLKETRFIIGKKTWSKAIARQFIRTKIRYALGETNIVLMQGGWKSPVGKMDWGVVDSIDFNGKLSGQTQWGKLPQESSPKKIIILSVGDSSDSPEALRNRVLKNAILQLNKSIILQSSSGTLLTGYDLVNYIADMSHKTPFCSKCKSKSYICMHKILNVLYNNFGAGVLYLNTIAKYCPDYEKKEITSAAEKLAAGREILSPFLNLNELKSIMADRKKQAEMGEEIRKLKKILTPLHICSLSHATKKWKIKQQLLMWQNGRANVKNIKLYVHFPDLTNFMA